MADNKTFDSASEAAAFYAGDDKFKNLVDEEISQNQISYQLLQTRISKNISQKELANLMGCDPSKISRMESGNDLNLKIGDIKNFLSALDVDIKFLFEDKYLPAAEKIKNHVYAIHDQLDALAKTAKEINNDEIIEKIKIFYGEVLLNFLIRYKDSHQTIHTITESKRIEKKQQKNSSS
ncbi:MAG: helix-turn-helix transcriptional regulator [Chlorobiaceae bacterium]|jgi:transcriptional regulator with XRE-family HTH domain|nr:helix-turn-helix transcriptional regulator [Chlorobiaceae bacterium]